MQATEEYTPPVVMGPSAFSSPLVSRVPSDLAQQKKILRAEQRAKRRDTSPEYPNASSGLAAILTAHFQLEEKAVIAGYAAFGDELNPTPALAAWYAKGHPLALPVVTGKGQPLLFRDYAPGDPLPPNAMGICEPSPSAPNVEPDVLLVPLLAFDRTRHRLGYGGGFYDRTLTALRARKKIIAIGVGYAFQEVAHVPTDPHDAVLDWIATEITVF